ncbi:MAG: sodium-dependent transporter [Phycisphaeraceae bacterium]|nr:sodium-dependent transporter [Phycisphaeraceae bacterium]
MGTGSGTSSRGVWGSKMGFVLAAAGSAIGLGNIWKFPYICGDNGGGAFVAIYLICIAVVGLPIMIGEIMIGHMAQRSPVGAFGSVAGRYSPWKGVGGLGVLAAFFMLSYYAVVAGWALHYTFTACIGGISGQSKEEVEGAFGTLVGNASLNVSWHVIFMGLTMVIVVGGIKKGIERWARILMPLLFLMLAALLWQATQLKPIPPETESGFDKAVDFVFSWNTDKLRPEGVLEALGHAFFTLSLGMGAMITYGSYLKRSSSLIGTSVAICTLDTVIALMACLILFPITFAYGMEPAKSAGLVFVNMPVALAQMPGGSYLSIVFFGLLVFAALTSAISLLEVVASYFIDQWKWSRKKATIFCGIAVTLFGIPSALSNSVDLFGNDFAEWKEGVIGEDWGDVSKGNWFDFLDYFVSNWMLPVGGFFIAIFAAWRVGGKAREEEFCAGPVGAVYRTWLILLRYIVPVIVAIVCLYAAGLLEEWGTIDWFYDEVLNEVRKKK